MSARLVKLATAKLKIVFFIVRLRTLASTSHPCFGFLQGRLHFIFETIALANCAKQVFEFWEISKKNCRNEKRIKKVLTSEVDLWYHCLCHSQEVLLARHKITKKCWWKLKKVVDRWKEVWYYTRVAPKRASKRKKQKSSLKTKQKRNMN